MNPDVIVVGSGPAGSVAASTLARSGCDVAVLDRPDVSRHRVGETLPGAAARALRRLDLPAPSATGPHRRVRGSISLWGGPVSVHDSLADPDGPPWRLDRARFDSDLRTTACQSGAELVTRRFRGARRERGTWVVTADDGLSLTAPWLIDATGRRSRVARTLGQRRELDASLIAVWGVGSAAEGTTDRTLIESAQDGWWYAVRLPDNRALAAFHTDPRTAARFTRTPGLWQSRLAGTLLIAREIDPARFDGLSPHVHDARGGYLPVAAGDGWLACGDAAISFDPLASQGLLNAILTGEAAAQVILAGGGDAATAYCRRVLRVRASYAARRTAFYAQLARSG